MDWEATKKVRLLEIASRLRSQGIDPDRMSRVKAFPDMVHHVLQGRWTILQLLDTCRKIAIVNRRIRLSKRRSHYGEISLN